MPIHAALSSARMSTYKSVTASNGVQVSTDQALRLYTWNAQISGALLIPMHVCEVAIRNAVSNALSKVYAPNWPNVSGFIHSLNFEMKGMLNHAKSSAGPGASTGKIIAEMKFAFWEKMFTAGHDVRIWQPHLLTEFPNATGFPNYADARKDIHDRLAIIRKLRNRIAHHEPIFSENLDSQLENIINLIGYKCPATSAWTRSSQHVSSLLVIKPI